MCSNVAVKSGPDSKPSDASSPWASDVPVTAPPVEFTWGPAGADNPSPDGAFGPPPGPQPGSLADPAGGDGESDQGAGGAGKRRVWLGVAGVAVVLAVIGAVLVTGGDGSERDAVPGDSIPVPADTAVAVDSEPTEPPVPPNLESDPDDDVADEPAARSDDGDATSGSEWASGRVRLPEQLATSEDPYTLVLVGRRSGYTEVDVPSGRTRSIALPAGVIDAQLLVGDTTTLLSGVNTGFTRSLLLNPGSPPIEVRLPGEISAIQVRAGTDEYVGLNFGFGSSRAEAGERSTVFADGTIESTVAGPLGLFPWQTVFLADGSHVITDAGGVYRVAEAGAADETGQISRLSTGTLVASSSRHLLVRECTETLACRFVIIEHATGGRTDAIVSTDDELGLTAFSTGSVEIAPDGRSIRAVVFRDAGVAEHLVDMVTGSSVTVDVPTSATQGMFPTQGASSWAADSSGYFRSAGNGVVVFVDREAGLAEVLDLGPDLDDIVQVGVRYPSTRSVDGVYVPVTSSGLRMIGVTVDDDIAEIDIDTGEVTLTPGPGFDSPAPVTVLPDDAGAWVVSFDETPSIRYDSLTADEPGTVTVDDTQTGPVGPLIPGPTAGTYWAVGVAADLAVAELVDATGELLGSQIDIRPDEDATVLGSDGRGGIVISSLGSTFVAEPDGASLLTAGEVLSLGPTNALVRECSDSLVCGVWRIDRVSGERSFLTLDFVERAGTSRRPALPIGSGVSPDGQVAFVPLEVSPPDNMVIVDLGRSARLNAPEVDRLTGVTWTADSAYAVWLSGGQLVLFDRANQSIRTLDAPQLVAAAPAPTVDDPAPTVDDPAPTDS